MRTRILVSSEVQEEVDEILMVLAAWGRPVDVLLAAPDIVGTVEHPDITVIRHYTPHARYGSMAGKIRGLIQFVRLALRAKPDLILSGFSMLKHRLASRLLGTPHVAYLRGLLFDANVRSGFSDTLAALPLIGRALGDLANTYRADVVWTVGELNRRFLLERKIPASSILLVGPVWLGTGNIAPDPGGPPRTVVLTSAYAAHGHVGAHEEQTHALADLAAAKGGEGLVLRVHPRDGYPYERDSRFAGVVLDRSTPRTFLASLSSRDHVLSPRSTLGFEAAFVGADVTFYSTPGPYTEDGDSDQWLKVVRLTPAILGVGAEVDLVDVSRVFSEIDLTAATSSLDALLVKS